MTVIASPASTAFDIALEEAADDVERERLRKLRLRFDIPPNSSEWQFYAVIAPLVPKSDAGDKIIATFVENFARVRADIANLRDSAPTPITRLVLQPSLATTIYLAAFAIAALFVSLGTWGVTRTVDDARFAAQAPRAAAIMLTTPGGHAAQQLLKANGDALAVELQRCRHYTDQGHDAIVCAFWNDAPAPASISTENAIERIGDFARTAPAWPLVAFGAPLFGLYAIARWMRARPIRVKRVW